MKKIKKENRICTVCDKCNKPFSFDKNNPPSDNLCRECRNKAKSATPQYDWDFPMTIMKLVYGEANRNEE